MGKIDYGSMSQSERNQYNKYSLYGIDPMRFKWFTFPHNPSISSYSCERVVAKHKYLEIAGAEMEDLDPDAAILTGNGVFFGQKAYIYMEQLRRVFAEHGVGDFYHPMFLDVNKVIFKKLEFKLEPVENYVSYTFEFWQHVDIVQKSIESPVSQPSAQSTSTADTVYTVVSGDYLIKIASKYGVDWKELAEYNNLKNPNLIYPGDKIKIPNG